MSHVTRPPGKQGSAHKAECDFVYLVTGCHCSGKFSPNLLSLTLDSGPDEEEPVSSLVSSHLCGVTRPGCGCLTGPVIQFPQMSSHHLRSARRRVVQAFSACVSQAAGMLVHIPESIQQQTGVPWEVGEIVFPYSLANTGRTHKL